MKETIKKIKRQPTEIKKELANHIADKRLLSKIHKEFIQLNNKRTSQLKNGEMILIGISLKKIYKKHKKRCSISVMRKVHIKITMRYYFTLTRMAIIQLR